MRWATVILAAVVAGAAGWLAAAGPYHQSNEVAATIAGIAVALVLSGGTKWANHSDPPAQAAVVASPVAPSSVDRVAQVVVGDLPGRAVAWQDRVDLLDRLTVMAGTGRAVVVCAVMGQRGIGKTQLAAAYARSRVAEGWPVVVWVVADTAANLVTGLDTLAAAVGVRGPDADPADAAKAALAWLRAHAGPCLLVYDNALDPDLIRAWLPPVGAVHTVVTTTRHDFENIGEPLDVTLFTPAEAVAYLRERTGLPDDTDAARLAVELGRLPLALACASAVIGPRRRYRTYGAYLDRLATMSTAEVLPRPVGDPYPHGAAEAVLLALDDLATADPDGHARDLLDRLAVLDPTGVDPVLLGHLTADDNAAAVLAGRSLTIPAVDTDRVVVHRLVQRVVRDHNHHLGRLDEVLIDTADRLEAAAAEAGIGWTDRARIAEYAQHVQTIAGHPGGDRSTRRVLKLRGWMVYRLARVPDTSRAIALGESHVQACEQLLGADHPDTLNSRSNLAGGYWTAGRVDEAMALSERTLADRERVLGPDHPDTVRSRGNLAICYRAVGRLDDAIGLDERTLADRERVLGPDHPDTLSSRGGLANSYWVVGRLDESISLHERTLADRERVLGPDHPDTLSSRSSVAIGYRKVGRLGESISLHEQTLADRERVLGPDHPDTLSSRSSVANGYRKVGRLDESISLHEQTLADRERVLGPDHPDTLSSRDRLADARRQRASRERPAG
ncbi:FxSxx-COOH system tetratricopeptide repeat protein [Dactylosporangium sp. NPDC005572]|uniref:FxSxx-COOH system tetratricopeptide repeat protein n=1 Tax=Dactylosporangium sp. NPDC005572 TaxID=3156889 RepID=UPI0033AC626F